MGHHGASIDSILPAITVIKAALSGTHYPVFTTLPEKQKPVRLSPSRFPRQQHQLDFLSGEKGLPLIPPGLGSDLWRLWLPARVGFHLERHIWKNSLDEYLGFILTMPRRAEGRERGSMLALCGALTDGRTGKQRQ